MKARTFKERVGIAAGSLAASSGAYSRGMWDQAIHKDLNITKQKGKKLASEVRRYIAELEAVADELEGYNT